MGLARLLAVAFLALNAAFWGLWPHAAHCRLVAALGAPRCPPHWVHLASAAVAFGLAVLVAQWRYVTTGKH